MRFGGRDGALVDAASGETFETYDPYTAQPWALIPRGEPRDVDRAVEAAHQAFTTGDWPEINATQRGAMLRKLGDLLGEHAWTECDIAVSPSAHAGSAVLRWAEQLGSRPALAGGTDPLGGSCAWSRPALTGGADPTVIHAPETRTTSSFSPGESGFVPMGPLNTGSNRVQDGVYEIV